MKSPREYEGWYSQGGTLAPLGQRRLDRIRARAAKLIGGKRVTVSHWNEDAMRALASAISRELGWEWYCEKCGATRPLVAVDVAPPCCGQPMESRETA